MEVTFGYDRVMNEKRQDRETLDLPSQPGTYALLLEATAMQEVPIGKLGVLHMLPGIYVYVGSALGPGGLAARVGRHALREKTLHWHIDYLRAETRLLAVWFARGARPGNATGRRYSNERPRHRFRWMDSVRRIADAGRICNTLRICDLRKPFGSS